MKTWFWGKPRRFSIFWSGSTLYINFTVFRFTVYARKYRVGAFRHGTSILAEYQRRLAEARGSEA